MILTEALYDINDLFELVQAPSLSGHHQHSQGSIKEAKMSSFGFGGT